MCGYECSDGLILNDTYKQRISSYWIGSDQIELGNTR